MAPDIKILTAISKSDLNDEIQRRLQDDEAQKARKLLSMVMGHKDAFFFVKGMIENRIKKSGNGSNNNK